MADVAQAACARQNEQTFRLPKEAPSPIEEGLVVEHTAPGRLMYSTSVHYGHVKQGLLQSSSFFKSRLPATLVVNLVTKIFNEKKSLNFRYIDS